MAKRTIKKSAKTGRISPKKARSAVQAVSGRYVTSGGPHTTSTERRK